MDVAIAGIHFLPISPGDHFVTVLLLSRYFCPFAWVPNASGLLAGVYL